MPILGSTVNYIKTGRWNAIFPTELWFPFNPANYYVPVYINHILAFGTYFMCSVGTETLILMILNHINQQFRHVAEDLSNCKPSDLKMILKRHKMLLG